jgi:hypothetical protein
MSQQAGPITYIVIGSVLLVVGSVMAANPWNFRSRYDRLSGLTLRRDAHDKQEPKRSPTFSFNRRWYWGLLALLGLAALISGISHLTS